MYPSRRLAKKHLVDQCHLAATFGDSTETEATDLSYKTRSKHQSVTFGFRSKRRSILHCWEVHFGHSKATFRRRTDSSQPFRSVADHRLLLVQPYRRPMETS